MGIPQRIPPDRSLQLRMAFTMLMLGLVYAIFLLVLMNILAGAIWTIAIVGAFVLFQFWLSDRMVLMSLGARIVKREEAPELYDRVERLAQAAAIPMPRVAVANSPMPNAFATGRSQRSATVAVTTGLIDLLDDREMEGVLAHEVSHIRTRDVQVMTYASFFAVIASTLMWVFFFSGMFGGFRNRQQNGAILVALLVTAIVWFLSQLLLAALSRYREYSADRGAAYLTGRPLDLAAALQRISGYARRVPTEDLRRTESMNAFIIIPAVGDGLAKLFSTHPNVEKRVAALQRLAREDVRLA